MLTKTSKARFTSVQSKQTGITLVELMVAMGLGLFLLAGIVQVFLGSKRSFDVIESQSAMQESARFAMEFIRKSVQHAGFNNEGDIQANLSQFVNFLDNPSQITKWSAFADFQDGAGLVGYENGALAGSKPTTDAISLRLQGDLDSTMLDCEGRPITSDPTLLASITFYISNNDELICQVFDGVAPQMPVVLVEGLENMQLLYGLATDPNQGEIVGEYVSADQVATDEWLSVLAVRVGIMARSQSASLDRLAGAPYTILNTQINDPADGRARQVFSQTVAVRNRILATNL